jgi:hypothetical protein
MENCKRKGGEEAGGEEAGGTCTGREKYVY